MIKGKTGTDKVVSVYWFAVIVIIAGGVFAMAYSFYGHPYDVREIEGDILANKIADCISVQGRLNEKLHSESGGFDGNFSDDFYSICNFNFNSESDYGWDKTAQYFTEINFYNLSDTENSVFEIKKGNMNYKQDCYMTDKKNKDYKKFAKCSEKRIYALDDSGKQYLIKILAGVAKTEKNVKL
jgi:hypothetical protein